MQITRLLNVEGIDSMNELDGRPCFLNPKAIPSEHFLVGPRMQVGKPIRKLDLLAVHGH